MADATLDAEKARILVVDDSKVMRVSASKLLGKEFDVVVAEDGQMAWDMLQEDDSIRMVFSDLSMPNLDGYGFLKKVRESDSAALKDLPVVIVTGGDDSEEAREEALNQGATDFIIKPFNSVDLKARARSYSCASYRTKQLKQEAEILQEKSAVDPLTGVYNKDHFIERVAQARAYSIRHDKAFSMVSIEVSNFNKLFVSYGRQIADALIRHIAAALKQACREEDAVARIGLARFSLLISDANIEGAEALVSRIHQDLTETGFQFEDKTFRCDLTAGIIRFCGDENVSVDALMEMLIDKVKQAQKDGVTICAKETGEGCHISVDEALQLIAAGRETQVLDQMDKLLNKIRPLLALADESQRQSLRSVLV